MEIEFTLVSEDVKMYIQRDDLKNAFIKINNELRNIGDAFDFTKEKNNLIILKSQLTALEHEEIKGTLRSEEIETKKNRIKDSLIKILDEIEYTIKNYLPKKINSGFKSNNYDESEIELKINKNISDFTIHEKNKLFAAIESLASLSDNIKITQIRKGSIYLRISVKENEAKKILKIIEKGMLSEFGVTEGNIIVKENQNNSDQKEEIESTELDGIKELIQNDHLELAIKTLIMFTEITAVNMSQTSLVALLLKDSNFKNLLLNAKDISSIKTYIINKLDGGFDNNHKK